MINQAAACIEAVTSLVPKAGMLAVPASAAVAAVLDGALADETRALSLSARVPSGALLDELTTDADVEKARLDAINQSMLKVTNEINSLLITQAARRRVFWRRWLPDTAADERIAELRAERRRLDDRYSRLHPGFVSAVAAHARAETAFKKEVAEAKAARARAESRWRSERDVVVRARGLITAWPAIAYAGVALLLRIARRIEDARQQSRIGTILNMGKDQLNK